MIDVKPDPEVAGTMITEMKWNEMKKLSNDNKTIIIIIGLSMINLKALKWRIRIYTNVVVSYKVSISCVAAIITSCFCAIQIV